MLNPTKWSTSLSALLILTGLPYAASAQAGDWYLDVDQDFPRMEVTASNIWLMRDWGGAAITLTGRNQTSCSANQLKLTPPAGLNDAWVSMALSALANGALRLAAYGTCDAANTTVNVSRIVVSQ